jgi:hypothetical protein
LAAGGAVCAQDKYTLEVPGGLAFSEFKGYEDWSVVAISQNGGLIAMILGNPEMIAAFREGVPDNGKPFPDGAKMAKIHWTPKMQESYPGQPTVPGVQHDIDFMVKDSKRFADSAGDMPSSSMTPRPIHSDPAMSRIPRRRPTTRSAASRATRS